MNEKLTEQQSLTVLVNAVRVAQQKGVYTLEEAELISKAIRTFTPPPPAQTPEGPIASE